MSAEAASDLTRLEDRYRAKADRLAEVGESPADDLTGSALAVFLRRYYWQAPVEDVLERSPAELAEVALAHYRLGRLRPQGGLEVRVAAGADGHTVVQIVIADMPFLVDSATAEIARQGLSLHHLVHPVLVVRRDVTGQLIEVCDTSDPGRAPADASVESWMHLEVDTVTGADARSALAADLRRVLTDVREAIEDWGKMRAAAVRVARELENSTLDLPAAELAEAAELLRWLADDHFTFLGYREYDLAVDDEGYDGLQAVPFTGLGILRSDSDMSRPVHRLPPAARARARERTVLVLTKADSRATVHRPVYLDYIGIKSFDAAGQVIGERRFLGLFSSAAYTASVTSVPVLRRKVADVLHRAHLPKDSHDGKDLLDILETYPRDELFQATVAELLPVVLAVLYLRERRQTRLFLRRDPYGRFWSALVYLPRDRHTTGVRLRFQQILLDRLGGTDIGYTARSSESVLARLHFVVRIPRGETADESTVDADGLQAELAAAARSWTDDLTDAVTRRHGAAAAAALVPRYEAAFSEGYKGDFPAESAVDDLDRLERLVGDELALTLDVVPGAPAGDFRFKVFRVGQPLLLSDVMPVLQHMGVSVVDERPYEATRPDGVRAWVYDFGLHSGYPLPVRAAGATAVRFQDAFAAVWRGRADDDGINALVLIAGLTWRQVTVLRSYLRYLRQGGLTFAPDYVEDCLTRHADICGLVVALFEARFDPERAGDRDAACTRLSDSIVAALTRVASLDEDRILSALHRVVLATVRTNYFQTGADGAPASYLSVKLDSHLVPDLPAPRPYREIWVHSPRFEGVHLRFGAVARGGLRWSDRREDMRTEVLGLVKAQIVKNTVIVPTGAKGGFVVRRPPRGGDRDAQLTEGIACYRLFICGLLDLTDNLETTAGGATVTLAPPRVVRHDGDDPYLVVAADKGTATFSDIANEVAESYGFWLGDAFASGGSAGYDHKAMGITARGAWESVSRHFRELGVDIGTQDVTVVGVGDMSGDVFGNGMLLSEHLRLVAAFDHRHIFLDPDPDPAASFTERSRLFALPRSSWADYDPALISSGGGVHPRLAKRIEITPPVRRSLGLAADVESLTPAELMSAILRAPVDLFWNGGIGTYVKASTESNADVGDRANDAVRIDGGQLRARVVGEGGNLGCTQLGRIEFARAGGAINTDAVDNSAGVDTSDHEVNLKIALGRAEREGLIDRAERNTILAAMTEDIADLVLADNYDQNAALACEQTLAMSLADTHARYIRRLVRDGRLDRALEFLPSDRALVERRREGAALTSPELAVLLAYTKIVLTAEVLASDLPDDPAVAHLLTGYFPALVRERFAAQIEAHPLRREIITTQLVNRMVNTAGVTGIFRVHEEAGDPSEEIIRAHVVAQDVYGLGGIWAAARALDNVVPADVQTTIRLEASRLAERATRWLLRACTVPMRIDATHDRFAAGVREVLDVLPELLRGIDATAFEHRRAELAGRGVPGPLAADIATFPKAISALDVVAVSERTGRPVGEVSAVYADLDDRLSLASLLERVIALPRGERFDSMARAALRDDLNAEHAELTTTVLAAGEGPPAARYDAWLAGLGPGQQRALATLGEVGSGESLDLARLIVAIRMLRVVTGPPAAPAPPPTATTSSTARTG